MNKNRGEYKIFESEVMKRLQNPNYSGVLNLKWSFLYTGNSKRPNRVIYDVYENGQKVMTRMIKNY